MLIATKLLLVYAIGRYCAVNNIKIVVDSEHFQGKWDNLNDFYSHMWVPKGDKNA